ncbi:TetR/AcrR family transcriptional regulator [Alkaliphilus serpentinus]|uniref:TetR/AcrR family transcriptional regulator n=1 Tax=Alkaliphilus serpentinus TaxID=1482731 RepID=A0A833HNH0_9FIRM|nr:TetR/AcrR family transcriptional regulator [Alkaliphilus serpentinus]KAB3529689.1 TetR/AcrR family transcriptional regulator [Alkaliphilus serpentinus]
MVTQRGKRQIEIIEAALKVFGENGFFQGTMEEVAKEAGIGKATIYEYFSSKKELFQEMLVYFVEDYITGAHDATEKENTVRSKLIALTEYNIAFVKSKADTLQRMTSRSEHVSEDFKCKIFNIKQTVCSIALKIVEKGIETGELRSDLDKNIAALIIIGALNSVSTEYIFNEEIASNTINTSTFVDILLSGLS